MTDASWCIFIAFLIPYFFVLIAKAGAKDYDNTRPRESLSALTSWRSRAYSAHLNGFEAFAPFAVAIILAQINSVEQSNIDMLAKGFIAFRLMHGFLYLTNNDKWRTLVWLGGFLCNISIFLLITSANNG